MLFIRVIDVKRLISMTVLFITMITLASCEKENISKNNSHTMITACSKDSLDDFIDAVNNISDVGLFNGYEFDFANCFNVTPVQVAEQTDYKIFKFSDSCGSFILIDGEIFELCASFGGYGFVNAVPCDFDADGNLDLLVASSCGSGQHRAQISVFNAKTKESNMIYDTSDTENPSIDLFITTQSLSISNHPIYYSIYSANVEPIDNNFANLAYTATGVVGSVEEVNGIPVFKAYKQ